MAIQVDLTDIVMAGSEMVFYYSAIKDAERFDTARIDAFEKRTDLFNKLKAKCEAQGYTVKQVKWFYGVQQYVDAMLNLQKNKHKALCKRFPTECSKAKAAFDEFMRSDDINVVGDAYKNWSREYERLINAAKILAYEVGEDDYSEVRSVSEQGQGKRSGCLYRRIRLVCLRRSSNRTMVTLLRGLNGRERLKKKLWVFVLGVGEIWLGVKANLVSFMGAVIIIQRGADIL